MKSHTVDAIDRQLVSALQLDGRQPFSRIAEVLGVSDQTIARRYTRLRTQGMLRVLGLTDPVAVGETFWVVRVRCTPDAAGAVAAALARRGDTRWVSLTSGGTEISCSSTSAVGEEEHALLMERLPRTPSVVAVSAHCVMHTFFGGSLSLVNKSGVLSAEQMRELRPPGPAPARPATPVRLDEQDRLLLAELGRDGRAGLAALATATGWSPSTVRRRMAELQGSGALYFDLEYDQRMFGLEARVLMWLSVAPSELAATGAALAGHPEIAYACATTGATNLYAVAMCPDMHSLYTYLTTRIASLPAVRQLETTPIMRTVKGPSPHPVQSAPARHRG
ncbi:Lrp/AsnC family transcriptional regulator [Streptacidiphilus sp. EB129]|uniref:Lrp/AsnC family transcriptional regulator n=1 Tax=Streptacidiphilus sp. EB129 TaxID=3156262 RepID=UPI0035170385